MEILLRLCSEDDIDVIYELVNDSEVRENSFNSNPIKYEEHCKWYTESLINENRVMYVAENGNCIVGQIRLDIRNDKALISYSVDRSNRGKGYGKKMLTLVKREAILNNISILEGLVKKNNIPSRNAFISNGFIQSEEDKYFKYTFLLRSRDEIEVSKNRK